MTDYSIVPCQKGDGDYILKKLIEYNNTQVPETQEPGYINLNHKIVNQDGTIVAGLLGSMYGWNCLQIDILWVDEACRGQRLGSRLLREVEAIARTHGCILIHLDTFDFQAKDFYLKEGFEVFGVLEGCPPGHKRYYLKKVLE